MCTDYLWVPIKNPEFSFVGIENNLQRESYSGFGLIFYIIWLSLRFVNVSAVCVCACIISCSLIIIILKILKQIYMIYNNICGLFFFLQANLD